MTNKGCIVKCFILGSLLFYLFINDLPSIVSHSIVHLFADDNFLYFSDYQISFINTKMNHDPSKISSNAKNKRINISTDKTRSILFVTNQHQ